MEHTEQHSRHILVVEDDVDVGQFVVEQLREAGYNVQWETSGQDGLRALQEATVPPNLILLDLQLPDISGEEVYAGVDAHPEWRAIPVIVMSGLSTGAARATTLSRGVYIQKPFTPPQLLALVAHECGTSTNRPFPADGLPPLDRTV